MKVTSSLMLAQQGDQHAIATLINKHVYQLGLSASAERSRRGLILTVEHPQQLPDEQWTTDFVHRLLSRVRPAGIQHVRLKGRVTGQRLAWQQQLTLDTPRPAQQYPKQRRDISTTLTMVSILALSVAGLLQSYRSQNQPWEYQLERVDAPLLQATLTDYGTQGWELTAAPKAIPVDDDETSVVYEIVFKRQVSPKGNAVLTVPPLNFGTVTDDIQFQTLNEQGQTVIKSAARTPAEPAVGSQFEDTQPPLMPPPLPVPAVP